jgi:tetraacyldisaccharide 4'-kinase
MARWPETIWYQKSISSKLLLPLSWLYCLLVAVRRRLYMWGMLSTVHFPVPIIVVGNITAGGTGKTPLVIWLVEYLRSLGYTPGVISRGYGGKAQNWPQQVRSDSDPMIVGDEAVLLSRRCACPMAVGPNRVAAARALLDHSDCNIIVSDDGLQHYALGRDLEIAVVDGVRRFGNGYCLPAGPLREKQQRLHEVDFVVNNGLAGKGEHHMELVGHTAINMLEQTSCQEIPEFQGAEVHALAGVGNPSRFFDFLRKHGLNLIEHPYPDHHVFQQKEVLFQDGREVLMTEKDAVKCTRFSTLHHWYVPVEARLDEKFSRKIHLLLDQVQKRLDQV